MYALSSPLNPKRLTWQETDVVVKVMTKEISEQEDMIEGGGDASVAAEHALS